MMDDETGLVLFYYSKPLKAWPPKPGSLLDRRMNEESQIDAQKDQHTTKDTNYVGFRYREKTGTHHFGPFQAG